MGTAKNEMLEHEEYEETRQLLLLMLRELDKQPTLGVEQLLAVVSVQLDDAEGMEELERLMAKDD